MALNSALEDLQETTLEAVSGLLRKLEYLSGLRSGTGVYSHWGLIRLHGDLAANRALEQAHRALLSQVLSTPLRELVAEVEQVSELCGMLPAKYLQRLLEEGLCLLPPEPGAGSERHLSSVLHALSGLAKIPKPDAIRPAA